MSSDRMPRDLPPMWQGIAIVVMIALHRWLPIYQWTASPWRYVGWGVIALGLTLTLLSAGRFRQAGTNVRPFRPVHALVVRGPFRFTRNPMYVGLVAITVGVAICLGTVSPLPIPSLLFVLLDRRFVRREEIFLREVIGEAYVDYCQRVRRWL